MGGSWDIPNTASGLGKSKWLAQGNLEEMPHKSNWNCYEGATQPLSFSEPAHVSIQTYYTLSPLNKYFLCRCSVTQSCPALCNPVKFSLLGSSVHGISQAGVGSSFLLQGIFPTQGSNWCLLLGRKIPYHSAWEALCMSVCIDIAIYKHRYIL